MPESIVSPSEIKSLHEMFELLVSRSEGSGGDFHVVEEAIGDLIANLRPKLESSGLKISPECSSPGYHCPQCECVSNILHTEYLPGKSEERCKSEETLG